MEKTPEETEFLFLTLQVDLVLVTSISNNSVFLIRPNSARASTEEYKEVVFVVATLTTCQQIVCDRSDWICVHLESSHLFPCFLQDDKDLVHEFVVAEGLTCLIKVGAEADQNYQNYILRGASTLAPLSLHLKSQPPAAVRGRGPPFLSVEPSGPSRVHTHR